MAKPSAQPTGHHASSVPLALSRAADAMFMEAAPDEAPLADDCPLLHQEMIRQARAAVVAFLFTFPADATVGDLRAAMGALHA